LFQVKEKEKQTLAILNDAKTKIRNEIRDLKERLKFSQENIQNVKEKVENEELNIEASIQ
jgi:predicted  nucleic acid-binding Zn-ribbon protein